MSFSKERKRTRGEIACAECRRLKTRCDKRVPCSTCIKRGCDMLCPNSTIPPGDGSRFVTAAEEFLHQKIVRMAERMHSLEDALYIIQSGSCKPHPLLAGQLLENREIEWSPEVDEGLVMDDDFSKYGLVDAFSSLYLNGEGLPSDGLHPPGTSGGSESLLHQAKVFIAEYSSPGNQAEEINLSYFPQEINAFHQAFPFTPPGIPTDSVQDLIVSYLPPFSRATTLCETFLQTIAWYFNIVSRRHILDELVPTVYRYANGQVPKQPRSYGPHDIALLFIIFALGTLLDPSLPPHNVEGQHYHILSRVAICLQPIFAQRSVITIKTLNLMSIYNGMCGIESKLEQSSSLLNLAAQMALQAFVRNALFFSTRLEDQAWPIDKDPSVWGITGREAYEHRTYFWSLLSGTLWQSLISGRPPVIMPSLIDSHIPIKEEEALYQSDETPLDFGIWSFSFTMHCLVPIVEATQGVRSPNYDEVLALDCKIREFSIPQASNSKQALGEMQTFMRSQLQDIALLFLHRNFFTRALADFPLDPLMSPFRQSVLAAYQSATRVLNTTQKQFTYQPVLCARVWRVWSFAFSAAIILAAVALKRLSISLDPEPLGQLDLACKLFREASHMSIRAQKALPILLRLRQEAMQVRLNGALGLQPAKPGAEAARQEEPRESRILSVDSSPERLNRHPMFGMGRTGIPSQQSSRYIPLSVVHSTPAAVVRSDEDLCANTAGVPLAPHGLHRDIPLTSPTSQGLPMTQYYF